jgi:15-cis-phytoene synthase
MDTFTNSGVRVSLANSPDAEPNLPDLMPSQNYFLISNANRLIADLVGSSRYQAVSDDAAKDEDNAGWVVNLEPEVRDQWIERIRWIRLIDRLAEQELLHPQKAVFQQFLADWQHLCHTGHVSPDSVHRQVLYAMQNQWFINSSADTAVHANSLQAWQQYMQAIATYHRPSLIINTFAEYEQLLSELAGSFFQVLPFLAPRYRQAARCFGMVDQFYNHLRDLREDAQGGICYLPNELLNCYGVKRSDLLAQQGHHTPNYFAMMQFWLDDYLPKLWEKGHALLGANDLHPSWQLMRSWSVHRYRRIERTFRSCQFDYTQFPEQYWHQVWQELPALLTQMRESQYQQQSTSVPTSISLNALRGWKRWVPGSAKGHLPFLGGRSQSMTCHFSGAVN